MEFKHSSQVSLSIWDEGSSEPSEEYSVQIDPSCANVRNPFTEKKWKKFQFSSIFGSSNAATKLEVIDVNLYTGGTRVVDRWLVMLSLGSGQTRNMALDRLVMILYPSLFFSVLYLYQLTWLLPQQTKHPCHMSTHLFETLHAYKHRALLWNVFL